MLRRVFLPLRRARRFQLPEERRRQMKYRALCTNWVDSLRRWYPEIAVVSDCAGDIYAECDNERTAEAIERINVLVGSLRQEL